MEIDSPDGGGDGGSAGGEQVYLRKKIEDAERCLSTGSYHGPNGVARLVSDWINFVLVLDRERPGWGGAVKLADVFGLPKPGPELARKDDPATKRANRIRDGRRNVRNVLRVVARTADCEVSKLKKAIETVQTRLMSDGSNYSKIQAEGKTISAGEEYDKLWGADGVADMVRGIMGVASSASSSASSSALPSLPTPQLSTFGLSSANSAAANPSTAADPLTPYSTYLLACDPSVGAEHGRSGFGFAIGWLSRTDGSVNRIDCGWFDTSQANLGPECHRSTLGGKDESPPGARRLGGILRGLTQIFQTHGAPQYIFMEAFESNQGIAHAELSHYVRGFVKALAPPSTLRIDEWMQQTWKKGLGVSAYDEGGDDDKGPTRRCVETLLGVSFPEKVTSPSTNNQIRFPSDISDAVAVLLYGMQVHNVLYKKGLELTLNVQGRLAK